MSLFYNTQHSPLGAFASFTLGAKGAKGGLGLELGRPAEQNMFIGVEYNQEVRCLPFYQATEDESLRYEVGSTTKKEGIAMRSFGETELRRTLVPGLDSWEAPGLRVNIHSPAMAAPDPASASVEDLKHAYVPAVMVEMFVENNSDLPGRLIFGFQGNDVARGMRLLNQESSLCGIASGSSLAIVGDPGETVSALGFSVGEILKEKYEENFGFGIGTVGLLIGQIPARSKKVFRFAVCFYRGGIATTGLDSTYLYTRYFKKIEDVAAYSLDHFDALKNCGAAMAEIVSASSLNEARKFMFAQALHSYYGSTQLLETSDGPLWAVNEGEYRMLNTFDLTVDQVYFETRFNPWTVRNELEWYVRRYSYEDKLRLPGSEEEFDGGISFTHDMGVANHFSPPSRSVYEKAGLHGCFSHMTQEELANWLACFLVYEHKVKDAVWIKQMLPIVHRCLESMLRRDHTDPKQRDGIMSLDSSRCAGGSEITTYDSLDVSLGQARNNLYLGVRGWGIYVGLEDFFRRNGDTERAKVCRTQAGLAAATVCSSANADGTLPAVVHENVQSRIIPAIEGLALPFVLDLTEAVKESGPYGKLVTILKTHLGQVLQKGVCLFPDGGWKISSTSNNSWLSKVYLCQFVADRILQSVDPKDMQRADEAHRNWLLHPDSLYWAWSDQMVDGVAHGSKYYPRGVTSILWFS